MLRRVIFIVMWGSNMISFINYKYFGKLNIYYFYLKICIVYYVLVVLGIGYKVKKIDLEFFYWVLEDR